QGGFTPGTRLPPERELALQLGVSRPSLREALLALEIEGRVEVRMSSGVYVCAPPPGASEALSLGDSPSELMQARSVLESSIIGLAMARATAPGLERVKSFLEKMRQEVNRGQVPLEADRGFHVAIAEMTGNSVLVRLVGELFDGRYGLISSQLTRRAESARTWAAAVREHEAIYQALEARDLQGAVAAMVWHLNWSRQRWIDEAAS
ncbi:MAG TPA: FadR/GntR family transcriptional regulator, partial [Ideonella sp.]|nr:FadR/GntR family transcriptional regulator [Ideonella sp.]